MDLIPFEDDSLTEGMVRKAEKELGETEERRESTLKELRQRIKDSQMVLCLKDDLFLLALLRARKFNVDRAIENAENVCRVKIEYADIILAANFHEILQLLSDKVIGVLPYRAENGSVIIVIQFERFKFGQMKLSVFLSALNAAICMLLINNAPSQICGVNVICDTYNVSVTNIRYVQLKHLYLVAKAISNLIPARIKSMHFINAPAALRVASNVIRSLLPEKLQKRYHFHANTQEALLKHFHPSILPNAYGGTCDYDNKAFINLMKLHEQRYHDFYASGFKPEHK